MEEINVRGSAEWIAAQSQDVRVDTHKCQEAAAAMSERIAKRSPAKWAENELHPNAKTRDVVDWIFTVDTLNFSFWSDLPDGKRFAVEYKDKTWTGYWSLVAAINRALDEGIPFTTPSFWVAPEFSLEVVKYVFRSFTDEEAPLLVERYEALKEAGRALQRQTKSASFSEILEQCDHSAKKVVQWLATNLKSYRDESTYKGKKVQFMKRAQILVGDLWACFEGKDWGRFDDIKEITMFADYRVPQILAGLGCISYSPRLRALLDEKHLFEYGDPEELELRGCSIEAVEQMLRYLPDQNAVLLDFFLWDTAKELEADATIPVHRVRSIYY